LKGEGWCLGIGLFSCDIYNNFGNFFVNCQKSCNFAARMTNVEIILNYAYEHDKVIVRKDFMRWFAESYPDRSARSMDIAMQQMVTQGTLVRTGYGVLRLGEGVKPNYRPTVNEEMKRLYEEVKRLYPYTNLCLWQASELGAFMQHVPNLNVLILEVEKVAAEAVYEDVRSVAEGRVVLLNPSEREYRLYASGQRSLLVKDLVSEGPVQEVDGVMVPQLEKILVDATVAPELEFARGGEIFTVFENAGEMYEIGRKTMLRYAMRRGRREEIEKLINATMV
jgi:hypothetical protein